MDNAGFPYLSVGPCHFYFYMSDNFAVVPYFGHAAAMRLSTHERQVVSLISFPIDKTGVN